MPYLHRRASSRLIRAIGLLIWLASAHESLAQEHVWQILPVRPINFDFALRQQTFAPNDRELTLQAGITAARYGNLEIRTIYQVFSLHSPEFKTDQHSVFVNPRWNNFLDVLDFEGFPVGRTVRHLLFGPLEDRAVPYVGVLGGSVMPGPHNQGPGYLYGGQVGVRFPVARGISLDLGVQYTQYSVDFRGVGGDSQQWLFLTGFRY